MNKTKKQIEQELAEEIRGLRKEIKALAKKYADLAQSSKKLVSDMHVSAEKGKVLAIQKKITSH